MIVSELIAALQKMPQDARVVMQPTKEPSKWDNEVRDVIYNDPRLTNKDAGTVELDNWPAEDFL